MRLTFLQTGSFSEDFRESYELSSELVFGFVESYFWYIMAFFLVLYLYSSYAYYVIAKRTNTEHAWLAWVPFFGKPVLTSKTSSKHWWPVILLFAIFLVYIDNIIIILIGISLATVGSVYFFIWRWKTLEEVGRPGWWVLLLLVPLFGIIIFAILLGVASWGKPKKPT